MGSPAEELEAVALALPRSERARLAEVLIASLDEDSELAEAWAQEVQERLDAFRRGDAGKTPVHEVMAEARSRLQPE